MNTTTIVKALLLVAVVLLMPAQAKDANPRAMIETNLGTITVELACGKAPITCENFIGYAQRYHYDGLIFHRVIKDFMVQTGGYWFDHRAKKAKGEPIKNESDNGLQNLRGTVAMARYNHPDSARAQFFINLVDNDHLDATDGANGYTVFGHVVEGMQIVDQIGNAPTHAVNASLTTVPVEPVQVQSITIQR